MEREADMRHFKLTLALAIACASATPALAADARLGWSDLDLATAAGKAELDRRIEAAAQQVCAPEAVTGSRIMPRSASASCLADARNAITAQVQARLDDHSRMASSQPQAPAVAAAR
jgi:UrcA family protein